MSQPGEPVLYRVPPVSQGLEWARNAVLSWVLARSRKVPFHLVCEDPERRRLLTWLGLDWDSDEPVGREIKLGPLQGGEELGSLRDQGFVSEAVMATLAACGWKPPRGRAGLTRAELLVRFDPEAPITEPVEWDRDLLEQNQRLFMTELTPREILERTLGPELKSLPEEKVMALEGVALLYGEEAEDLNQCRRNLEFFFAPPELPEIGPSAQSVDKLENLDPWESLTLEEALADLPDREAVERAVLGRSEPFAAELLALLGRQESLARVRRAFKSGG